MVQNFIAKERIIWENIIERSLWWGGFYERLARSVKEIMHKILGKALLSCEEMTTILTEIEAVLNLRPLSYVYEENDEPRHLTPVHFLNFGQNQPTCPVTFAEILENASTKSSLLKRKKYQQLLLKQLIENQLLSYTRAFGERLTSHCSATRGLLATDHVILNHGQDRT
ncbi:integrase catalytic domain-containing protein [Trichonephila clavipes]|nr:integrase catalytic domain-containing protein [Trichonephila clavipes]